MSSNKEVILGVLDIAVNVGVPIIIKYIETLNKTDITAEDIADLRERIKQNPEEYFS